MFNIININNFLKINKYYSKYLLNLSKNISNLALKKDKIINEYLYEEKKKIYNEKCLKYIFKQDLATKCIICKGLGWIHNPYKNKIYDIDYGYELCYKCNGTGLS
tara:strand:- start:884 stop:1198 length:315 start_codon:yes stop_codon:yes gene_type:complete